MGGTHDLEDIFRVYQDGCVPHNLRKGRRSGSDYRSSVCQCIERGEAKALVERGAEENIGYVIKNSEHVDGHKTEETDIVMHAAANHRAPQVRMAGKVVA